jgi:hypothetical protein
MYKENKSIEAEQSFLFLPLFLAQLTSACCFCPQASQDGCQAAKHNYIQWRSKAFLSL